MDNKDKKLENLDSAYNQELKAEDGSSIIGAIQAGNIVDSTINIHIAEDQLFKVTKKDSLVTKPKVTHNLPERNRFFTGREDVLNQLSDLIKSNEAVAIKQAIAGLGGIGKTQTAIEFCYKHINDYQTILWARSETQTDLDNSYLELAKKLKLVSDKDIEEGLKTKQIVEKLKEWLGNNPKWLMVLDNLEDTNLITKYLPTYHQSHILITTRSQTLKGYAEIVSLKKMSIDTGTLFLLKRAKLIHITHKTDEKDKPLDELLSKILDKDKLLAEEIVKEMDGLPLALEQAGAYIHETKCSLSDYLTAYRDVSYNKTILDNDGEDTNDHKSVFATFNLAFDKVKEQSSVAADLLKVCSVLSPESIPEEIFTEAGDLLGDELAKVKDNLFEFNKAIKILRNYSLVERDANNKFLSIHRLVQAVIRNLIDGSKDSLLERLVKAFVFLCSKDAQDPNNWKTYQRSLFCTTTLLNFANLFNLQDFDAATLFHQFGIYCYLQALYSQSLDFYHQSLTIRKYLFGENHSSVAASLHNIAFVYDRQGKYSEALDFYQQALNIRKYNLGHNDPIVAKTLNNIAIIYDKQGKYSEALDFYQQAAYIFKYYFGSDDLSIGAILHNIALVYQNQGKYFEALDFYQQALNIKKHNLGHNHPDVADTLNNIANVYREQAKYPEALDLFNQALKICKHHFGDNHPDIADTFNNIAEVYREQAKYPEALDLFNQALKIYKHHFGNNHPDVSMTLVNIAIVYAKQNQHSEALDLFNQALKIYKHHFGDNHPEIAVTLENLGYLYADRGKEQEAIDYYRQALTIYEQRLPSNHPKVTALLKIYSTLLLKLSRNDEAEVLLDRLAALDLSN